MSNTCWVMTNETCHECRGVGEIRKRSGAVEWRCSSCMGFGTREVVLAEVVRSYGEDRAVWVEEDK